MVLALGGDKLVVKCSGEMMFRGGRRRALFAAEPTIGPVMPFWLRHQEGPGGHQDYARQARQHPEFLGGMDARPPT